MIIFKNTTDVGRRLTRANRVLVETAVKKGVEVKRIPGEKRRFRMTYGNDSYLIKRGYIFSTYNHSLALRLCKRKNVASNYLRTIDIPVPKNVFFDKDEVDRAWDWAKHSLPIVLKPNNGKSGNMVYVNVDSEKEFYELFNRIANKYGNVLVEEMSTGTDHRVLVVKNKVVTALKRIPANVIGDGESTIKELISIKNKTRTGQILKHIKLDEEGRRNLSKVGYDYDSVPNKNEQVFLRSNANISDGGDSYESTAEVSEKVIETIERAIRLIPGLNVCGVDAFIDGDNVSIIELNGSPMIDIHYDTSCGNTVPVANNIIEAMFPDLKNK